MAKHVYDFNIAQKLYKFLDDKGYGMYFYDLYIFDNCYEYLNQEGIEWTDEQVLDLASYVKDKDIDNDYGMSIYDLVDECYKEMKEGN